MTQSLDEYNAKRERATAALKKLFQTNVGRDVLDILADEFQLDKLRGETPHDTYYNLDKYDAYKTFVNLGRKTK